VRRGFAAANSVSVRDEGEFGLHLEKKSGKHVNMKNLLLVAGLCISTFAAAQCKVYSGPNGYKVAARVENGRVYLGASGYQVAVRFENNRIYSGASGYTVIARVDGDKIYSGNSGYDVIGRISGDKVYQGRNGYTVAVRNDGCGGMSLAAAAVACCL
jgi:hypothetical protein